MRRISVDPEAEAEIGAAAGWYEGRLVGLGLEYLAALDRAFDSIRANPEQFPLWRQRPPFRRFLLKRFPYVVFYEVEDDGVIVRAVAHVGRKPGYWVTRRPQ